ncbi:MAG: GNAT family N-acetyltransferase [Steroidobacteraceae bacterium]
MGPIRDNVERQRFELEAEGQIAFINYRRQGGVVVMNHAEVPAALNGRGIGSALVKEALELVRSRNETVVPVCSFIVAYIRRHPEYQSLLARN